MSWWKAEGNTIDSISGANGTVSGGVTFFPGMVGNAFSFNGVNGGINVPDVPALALTHSLSIEGWLYVTNAPSVTGMVLFRGDTRPAMDSYFLSVEGGGILRFAVENQTDTAYIDSVMPTGGWTHVAATLDDATGLMKLYTNGVVAAQTTTSVRPLGPLDPASGAGIGIGNHSHVPGPFNYPFRGLIDELSVYSSALSASQVQALYNAGIAGKCVQGGGSPVILTQPTNQTVNAGVEARFIVAADGAAPLSYQWFKGTNLLNGATTASYTIPNPQPIDEGTYSVVVTNNFGFAVSSNATLTVIPPATNCLTSPSGLVAWWRGEGNANDSVDGGNGTTYGGVSFAPGRVGSAFSFNGIDGAVNVPDVPALALTNSLTIEGWIYVTNRPTVTGMILFRGDTRSGLDPYFLHVFSQGETLSLLRFAVTAPNNNITYIDSVLPVGNWTHIAATLDDATGAMRLYTNGVVAVETITSVRPLGPLDPGASPGVGIGNHSRQPGLFNYPFRGLIDELSLYNRALSISEIQALYSAGSAGKCPPETGPTILSQPADLTVNVGATAAFSVEASGTPLLTYQWFKGTESIPGATSNVYTILNARTNDAGSYSVLVSNSVGFIWSSNAVLTVLLPETNCVFIPKGLVAWWRAEGNFLDSIDGGNGIPYGAVSFAPGRVGTAFAFNGTDGGINVPDVPTLAVTNGLTIEGWIFVTNPPAGPGMILFRGDTRSGLDPYFLDVEPEPGTLGRIRFAVTDQNNNITYVDSLLPVRTWTHVAGTLDNSSGLMRIYTNGIVAVETTTTVRPLAQLDPAFGAGVGIGNHSHVPGSFNYPFNGLIDELSLYNRGLSSNEVQGLYMAGRAGKCFGLPPQNVPPVPIISVSPLSRFPGDTNLIVISRNNTNALVTFDGRMSYDFDDATFNFAWLEAGTVFSTNSVASRVLALGTHIITLRLDDTFPMGVSSAEVTVEVITPAEAVAILIDLVDNSNLPQNTKQSLKAKLLAAANAFDRGNFAAGANILGAFQNNVNAQVRPFDSTLADRLLAGANAITEATKGASKGNNL